MRILGIDPALSVTGYGVVDSDKDRLSLVKAGTIITSSRDNLPARLNKICAAVTDLISETSPEVLVLEKLYVHYRHPTTAYILGQARGIICLVCAKGNIPLVEYAATQVKKAIVGRGLASKSQIQKMVAGMLNLKELPRYSDVTDALALAITYSHTVRTDVKGQNNALLAAISDVRKLYRRRRG